MDPPPNSSSSNSNSNAGLLAQQEKRRKDYLAGIVLLLSVVFLWTGQSKKGRVGKKTLFYAFLLIFPLLLSSSSLKLLNKYSLVSFIYSLERGRVFLLEILIVFLLRFPPQNSRLRQALRSNICQHFFFLTISNSIRISWISFSKKEKFNNQFNSIFSKMVGKVRFRSSTFRRD